MRQYMRFWYLLPTHKILKKAHAEMLEVGIKGSLVQASQWHYVVALIMTLCLLLSNGSAQEMS